MTATAWYLSEQGFGSFAVAAQLLMQKANVSKSERSGGSAANPV